MRTLPTRTKRHITEDKSNDTLRLHANHCPSSPPVDPPVGDVVDQNDLCLRVRRANHLCVVADGREAHAQRLCWRGIHRVPVEPIAEMCLNGNGSQRQRPF